MRSFPPQSSRAALFTFFTLVLAAVGPAAVAQPAPAGGGDAVVARVGSREITVAELEQRIRQVPLYQLRVLGRTPDEIRRAFLEHEITQELLVQGARAERLDRRADVRSRFRAVLRSAMLAQTRTDVGDGTAITDDEIASYYREHEARYRSEKLLKLWQIVVPTRELAARLLDIIKNDASYQRDPIKGWGELAAKHSIDARTKKRKGNLDFVRPDGSTKRPDVKVSPALYQAAEKVADGEVVPEPVPVGDTFVIVSRRGSRVTPQRTLDNEAPAIRRRLAQERYEQQVKQLKERLRKQYTSEHHPERVDRVLVTVPHGDIVQASRPGGLPRGRHPSSGSPRPVGRPGQLR